MSRRAKRTTRPTEDRKEATSMMNVKMNCGPERERETEREAWSEYYISVEERTAASIWLLCGVHP